MFFQGVRAVEVRWMGKKFQAYNLDQPLLLPPDRRQWSPERHLALFLFDEVNELDLNEIVEVYERKDGAASHRIPGDAGDAVAVCLLHWQGVVAAHRAGHVRGGVGARLLEPQRAQAVAG
jgi:hypothetical protein